MYVNGRLAKREGFEQYAGFVGNQTLIRMGAHNNIEGSILIDDMGFFRIGFSSEAIRALYDSPWGLEGFLKEGHQKGSEFLCLLSILFA